MLYLLFIPGIFILDFFIKKKIENAPAGSLPKETAGGFITICRSHNYGMMMNTLDKYPQLAGLISACSGLFCLIWYLRELLRTSGRGLLFGGALVLGGAAGNIYDHLIRGYVVDYFKLHIKPIKGVIFNISDFCIFIGCGIIVLKSLFQKQ